MTRYVYGVSEDARVEFGRSVCCGCGAGKDGKEEVERALGAVCDGWLMFRLVEELLVCRLWSLKRLELRPELDELGWCMC